MAATVTAPVRGVPRVLDVHEPGWLERFPTWATNAALLVVLMAASAYVRTRYISASSGWTRRSPPGSPRTR